MAIATNRDTSSDIYTKLVGISRSCLALNFKLWQHTSSSDMSRTDIRQNLIFTYFNISRGWMAFSVFSISTNFSAAFERFFGQFRCHIHKAISIFIKPSYVVKHLFYGLHSTLFLQKILVVCYEMIHTQKTKIC